MSDKTLPIRIGPWELQQVEPRTYASPRITAVYSRSLRTAGGMNMANLRVEISALPHELPEAVRALREVEHSGGASGPLGMSESGFAGTDEGVET